MKQIVPDCIWCKRPVRRASIEHILPDSLGCPPQFVLTDCVCMRCNNGLGHVDQALLREFEIVSFLRGVRRKGGKPPVIENWAAIRGRYGAHGPEMYLNAGPQVVDAWGKNLQAAKPHNGIHGVTAQPMILGEECELKFNQRFGAHPKFRRAVYKVAFGTLTYFRGASEALRANYDFVRAFVRRGLGEFDVVMMAGSDEGGHYFCKPVVPEGLTFPIVEIGVFGVSFAVDLDPEQKGLQLMRSRLAEGAVSDWTVLPRAA